MAFTPEQIEQWTKEGHWPPAGIIVDLPKPDSKEVKKYFDQLINFSTPAQQTKIKEAISKIQS